MATRSLRHTTRSKRGTPRLRSPLDFTNLRRLDQGLTPDVLPRLDDADLERLRTHPVLRYEMRQAVTEELWRRFDARTNVLA